VKDGENGAKQESADVALQWFTDDCLDWEHGSDVIRQSFLDMRVPMVYADSGVLCTSSLILAV
jgi:hypothetical protein